MKLKALDFAGAELLSREQLKKILGGGMLGTIIETTNAICTCCDGKTAGYDPNNKDICNTFCEDHGGVDTYNSIVG